MTARRYMVQMADRDGAELEKHLDGALFVAWTRPAGSVPVAGLDAVPELPPVDGEPLTHFWHCWRFPDHHACAVALVERQAAEYDRLLVRAARAEEARAAAARAQASPDRCHTPRGAAEFEERYAARSGVTAAELHQAGRYAEPCACGQSGCEGWAMGNAWEDAIEEDRARTA